MLFHDAQLKFVSLKVRDRKWRNAETSLHSVSRFWFGFRKIQRMSVVIGCSKIHRWIHIFLSNAEWLGVNSQYVSWGKCNKLIREWKNDSRDCYCSGFSSASAVQISTGDLMVPCHIITSRWDQNGTHSRTALLLEKHDENNQASMWQMPSVSENQTQNR